MRIGYVVTDFSPLSESFIRREVLALCREGQRVFVYTNHKHNDSRVEELSDPNLVIREVPFTPDAAALAQAAHDDGIDHLHGSLMSAAHRATWTAARKLQTPFTLRAYSGLDIFTRRDPDLYRNAASDPLCISFIVEDAFMRDWTIEQLGVTPSRISIIPNSFDLDVYRLVDGRTPHEGVVILAIARFVEKKGLSYLVEAFNRLSVTGGPAELWLVGFGPEESRLRQLAGGNNRIKFLGGMSEAETRRLYATADIFCLPCIRTASGDADGIPTTILEAMAFELSVVTTNLLSMSCYVKDGYDGILVPPGDAGSLASALERLCADAPLRAEMGRAARCTVAELCNIKKNVGRLIELFTEGRWTDWRAKLAELEKQRSAYTAERQTYYSECYKRAVNYFDPGEGKLLDIGCGLGKLRDYLSPDVVYYGCDTLVREEMTGAFPFTTARAESLPFKDNTFDAAVFYAVLIHAFEVDAALREAARILKPGGRLYLQECYDDPNPIHMNHFSGPSLRSRVAEHFSVIRSDPANEYLMMIVAEKPFAIHADVSSAHESGSETITEHAEHEVPPVEPPAQGFEEAARIQLDEQFIEHLEPYSPRVCICITTYNRADLVRVAIDSVLRQTYPNVEVAVVDDGSSDDTRLVLESYGSSIRVEHNERNRGMSISKNRALMMSSSDVRYIGILDSDDYYDPQWVERCVDYLESHSDVGLVYTDDILVDTDGRELRRQPAVAPWDIDKWLRTRNVRGDTWLARRALVMQTRLHDVATEHDHDYDLFYQLLEITTFAHVPGFLAFIRQHNGRSTMANPLPLACHHAANLVKYGFSPEYAYLRARANPEWIPAIEEGVLLGRRLRNERDNTSLHVVVADAKASAD